MDPVIVREKRESLRRCVARVEERTPPDVASLTGVADIQDIVVLNLTRAIQLWVDIGSHIIGDAEVAAPRTMGGTFEAIRQLGTFGPETCEAMTRAMGFRNIAICNYTAIDWEIVRAICAGSLSDFRRFAGKIGRYARLDA